MRSDDGSMLALAVAAAAAFQAPLRPHAPVTVAPRLATVRPVTVPLRLSTVRRRGLSPLAVASEVSCIDEPSSFACPIDEPPVPENEDWLRQALPVLVLCCAIAAICALDRVVMSVAILPMTEQYGYTDVQKGQIASAFSVGYCLSQLPSGTLAALTSPKAVLLGGLVVWSAAQATSPAVAAVGPPALLGMRAVMGAGEAACTPSLQAVAAKFVPAKRRSLFWGVLPWFDVWQPPSKQVRFVSECDSFRRCRLRRCRLRCSRHLRRSLLRRSRSRSRSSP